MLAKSICKIDPSLCSNDLPNNANIVPGVTVSDERSNHELPVNVYEEVTYITSSLFAIVTFILSYLGYVFRLVLRSYCTYLLRRLSCRETSLQCSLVLTVRVGDEPIAQMSRVFALGQIEEGTGGQHPL